jgi:hypothetical protein
MKLLFLILPMTLIASDADFNGRWNLRVPNPRNRIWWLEVKGAGSGAASGSFVGAPGGQVDAVPQMRVEKGELAFQITKQRDGKPLLLRYRARLEGGRLQGSVQEEFEGNLTAAVAFTGERAPRIADADDGGWQPGPPVQVFDGKSLDGWIALVPSRPGWRVEDGLLKNNVGASDLVSSTRFWNFVLHAEYRYAKGSNSGIALRGRYEVQIYDDFGQPPGIQGHGALYGRAAPAVNAGRAPGEWQQLEARLVGRQLTVTLNGRKVLDRVDVVGPTAMGMDAGEGDPGPIVLQGDHGPVEFRKLVVVPLRR